MTNDLLGSAELARRYNVSRRRANQVLHRLRDDGVLMKELGGRLYVIEPSLEVWEASVRERGQPFPGEGRRGRPRRKPAP